MTNLNKLNDSTLLAPLEWHNDRRKVKDLVPYEFNPRILTDDKRNA